MSKTKAKAGTRTEFKLTEKATIIVSDSTRTICGIRIPKGNNKETLIVSSNPSCDFSEVLALLLIEVARNRDKTARISFVKLLHYVNFEKDSVAFSAISDISNFSFDEPIQKRILKIINKHKNHK